MLAEEGQLRWSKLVHQFVLRCPLTFVKEGEPFPNALKRAKGAMDLKHHCAPTPHACSLFLKEEIPTYSSSPDLLLVNTPAVVMIFAETCLV